MTEMTSVGMDAKVCKVCSPTAKTPCQLSSTMCPYRDIDTYIDTPEPMKFGINPGKH